MLPKGPAQKRSSSSEWSKDDSKNPMDWIRSLLRRSEGIRWLTMGRCLVLSVPAVLFLWTVFGIAQNNTDVRKRHTAKLAENWLELGASGNDEVVIMTGERLLDSGSLGNEDYFRLFDAYVATGKSGYAVHFLESLESAQAASELAEFRARFAEKLIELKPRTPENDKIAFEKLQQSLAGPLSKEREKKVRVTLASLAKATGNADVYMKLLQPLAVDDREIATELLWTQWLRSIDEESPRIRTSAMEEFDRLKLESFQRVVQTAEKPAESVYMRLARLHFITGRPEDFFTAIRDLPAISADLNSRIQNSFDEMRVISEISRKNPRSQIYATTLTKILNRENVEKSWVDLATKIWASQNLSPIDPVRLWMKNYQNSPKADYDFFMSAAQACHANAKWDDARAMYEKAIDKKPESLVALNNLAAMYYRFPPRDLAKALALSDRALKVEPGMIGVAETRAQILARMGKLDEARRILESALPVFPQEWNIHNTLAQIYAIQGTNELAKNHADRAAELKRPPGAEFYDKLDLATSTGKTGENPGNAKPEAAAGTEPKPTDR
jgi:tetratricopeptide (TPR) repeat protein